MNPSLSQRLTEVAKLFLKLGMTAFGGPAAHIAMMHDETVKRRKWLSDQEFLDLVGATNLIPGPNSTEMAIHIGFLRAGWRGLIVGGACFIVPAMLIVLLLGMGICALWRYAPGRMVAVWHKACGHCNYRTSPLELGAKGCQRSADCGCRGALFLSCILWASTKLPCSSPAD